MKKLSLLLVAILCLTAFAGLSALAENNDDMVVVATQFGQIRGDQVSDDLIIYKGVPYAAPPVGELRWKAPIDPEPWEGVLDCTEFNPMGMQVMDMECWWAEDLWYPWLDEYPNMSEDSLYLQIYSPAKSASPTTRRPRRKSWRRAASSWSRSNTAWACSASTPPTSWMPNPRRALPATTA